MKRCFFVFFMCLFLTGCGNAVREYSAVDTAMGTVVTQRIYTEHEDVTEDITVLLLDLEREELSRRKVGSVIGRINAAAGSGEIVVLPHKLQQELIFLQEFSQKSEGAFDSSLGGLCKLWDIDTWATKTDSPGGSAQDSMPNSSKDSTQDSIQEGPAVSGFVLPTPTEIQAALEHCGYEKISLTKEGISIPEGMVLDLGAAGKGIACDRIHAFLQEQDVEAAVISIGGSVLVYGDKPDNTVWQVAVTDPFHQETYIGTLYLKGTHFVATSGDYERYVEMDGVRYHHILDPFTGYPADSGVVSVTIVSDSGMLSDALSTACFVMGADEGMKLAEEYDAEALFVLKDGSLLMSEGMEQIYREYR